MLEDPRMKNRSLPNDSILTYKYGARVYEHPLYPGFAWRNGFWYVVDENTKFTPNTPGMHISIAAHRGPLFDSDRDKLKPSELMHHTGPLFAPLSDVYVPILIGGHRCFVAGGTLLSGVSVQPLPTNRSLVSTTGRVPSKSFDSYLQYHRIDETNSNSIELKVLLDKYKKSPAPAELFVYNPDTKQITVGYHRGYSNKAEDNSDMASEVTIFVMKGIYGDEFYSFVKNYKPALLSGLLEIK
jgi:hypothetical protein